MIVVFSQVRDLESSLVERSWLSSDGVVVLVSRSWAVGQNGAGIDESQQ